MNTNCKLNSTGDISCHKNAGKGEVWHGLFSDSSCAVDPGAFYVGVERATGLPFDCSQP